MSIVGVRSIIVRAWSFPQGWFPRRAFAARGLATLVGVCTALACGGASSGDDAGDGRPPSRTSEQGQPASPPRQTVNPAGSSRDPRPDDPFPIGCTDVFIFGLAVTIENSPIDCADLAVVASSGSYAEGLSCAGDEATCFCIGAGERRGTYQISVSAGDPPVELAQAGPVTVAGDACHVAPRFVTLLCAPLDAGAPPVPDSGVSPLHDAGPSADAGGHGLP
jgi:hypothetical protein